MALIVYDLIFQNELCTNKETNCVLFLRLYMAVSTDLSVL